MYQARLRLRALGLSDQQWRVLRVLVEHGTKISQPSYELRRTLDLMGEKFAREWSGRAGVEGASALITYYFPTSKS